MDGGDGPLLWEKGGGASKIDPKARKHQSKVDLHLPDLGWGSDTQLIVPCRRYYNP